MWGGVVYGQRAWDDDQTVTPRPRKLSESIGSRAKATLSGKGRNDGRTPESIGFPKISWKNEWVGRNPFPRGKKATKSGTRDRVTWPMIQGREIAVKLKIDSNLDGKSLEL